VVPVHGFEHEHAPLPVVPWLHKPPLTHAHTPVHEAPKRPVMHCVQLVPVHGETHVHTPLPDVPWEHDPPFWQLQMPVHVAP
jgi:hypothetical protein